MSKRDPHRITIQVPVHISFSTNPDELDDRDGKLPRPQKASWHTSRMRFGSTWTTRAKGNPRVPCSLPPEWTGAKQNSSKDRGVQEPE